jgi:hypothetical protein
MRNQRLIFLYLFILFTGTIAQQLDNADEVDDEEAGPSNNNGRVQNRIPTGNINNNNDNQLQKPGGQRVQPPTGQGQGNPPVGSPSVQNTGNSPGQVPAGSNSRSQSTQLAADDSCKGDIQKYCGKGSSKLLSNLKVLQCVDDLDNVSLLK